MVLVAVISLVEPTISANLPGYPGGVTLFVILSRWRPNFPFVAADHTGSWFRSLLGLLVTAVVSLVLRARAATGIERQQLRWVAGALVLVAGSQSLRARYRRAGPGIRQRGRRLAWPSWRLPQFRWPSGSPFSRYRLYEIDTIINRTVLYGAVTLLVLAIFGVANSAFNSWLQAWLGGHSVLLAGFLGIVVGMLYVPIQEGDPTGSRPIPAQPVATSRCCSPTSLAQRSRSSRWATMRWQILLGRYRAAVRQELSSYSGQEVDTAGDSFFATFQRPAQGVRCAVAIRQASAQLGIQLRTGLHLGEVEMRGETLTGIEVHTAARVMAAAEPGEILLSAAVREAIQNSQFATTDRGSRELKGVPGSWHLFGLDTEEGTVGSSGESPRLVADHANVLNSVGDLAAAQSDDRNLAIGLRSVLRVFRGIHGDAPPCFLESLALQSLGPHRDSTPVAELDGRFRVLGQVVQPARIAGGTGERSDNEPRVGRLLEVAKRCGPGLACRGSDRLEDEGVKPTRDWPPWLRRNRPSCARLSPLARKPGTWGTERLACLEAES